MTPPNGTLECYLCHKSHKSRSDLRQHIFCHLKQEIQNKFYPGEEPIKSCVECTYKSIQPEHILMHLALKHQKIAEFVPKEVIHMIYKDKSIKVLKMIKIHFSLEEKTETFSLKCKKKIKNK